MAVSCQPGVNTLDDRPIGLILRAMLVLGVVFVPSGGAPASGGPHADTVTSAAFVGLALDAPTNYSRDFLFTDAMKTARPFATLSNMHEPAEVDSNGWPTGDAQVIVWAGLDGVDVGGVYKFSVDGDARHARITANDGATFSKWEYSHGRTIADLNVRSRMGVLALYFQGVAGGVKNVKLIRPGYTEKELFTREYLARLTHFSVLRTLDFVSINDNPSIEWRDRTPPGYATQSERTLRGRRTGVAWEAFIALCNSLRRDAWITIPDQASDDYVEQLAMLFRYGSDANGIPYTSPHPHPINSPLDPSLKLYVEWSNEVWNWSFGQAGRAFDAARAEVTAGDPHHLRYDGSSDAHVWWLRYAGYQVARVSSIFRAVLGDSAMMTRVRPVLATHTADEYKYQQALRYLDHVWGPTNRYGNPRRSVNQTAFGLAGTTYAYLSDPTGNTKITLDQYFEQLDANRAKSTRPQLQALTGWAYTYGLMPMCYEGSQHTLVAGATDDSDPRVQLQIDAQYDRRMKQWTLQMYRDWFEVGGKLHAYSSSVYAYDRWGQWGLGEWPDREDEPGPEGPWKRRSNRTSNDGGTPKWAAVKEVMASSLPTPTVGTTIPAILTPSEAVTSAYLPGTGNTSGPRRTLSGSEPDISYIVHVVVDRTYAMATTLSGSGTIAVDVDGTTVATWSGPGPKSHAVTLATGLHGIRVRLVEGTSATFAPLAVQ